MRRGPEVGFGSSGMPLHKPNRSSRAALAPASRTASADKTCSDFTSSGGTKQYAVIVVILVQFFLLCGAMAMTTAERAEHPEQQYLALVREIITQGVRRDDRTGTGTMSLFGRTMRFPLADGAFPLLTTKSVFWRGVVEELLWFIRGSTDVRELAVRGVHIWDANVTREALDKRSLRHYDFGDMGPGYGFQWRHFGAVYSDMHGTYDGCGVDQLLECIRLIRTEPTSRRIVMTSWNPADLPKMALPPCHMMCQFYVANGRLSCMMTQRSADMGLGVPFNIASYALLTCLVAHVCELEPGEFVHVIGDAHVYLTHCDALAEQLTREPRRFPRLRINPAVRDIERITFADIDLAGYTPHPALRMPMAV